MSPGFRIAQRIQIPSVGGRMHASQFSLNVLGFALPFLASILLLGSGCQSMYYATMEKFGYEKRDLLKRSVNATKDDQKAAQEQFQDALTRMQEMYGVSGSKLERTYNRLKADLDACESRAKSVRKRIERMDQVAADLFKEWAEEIGQFTNPAFAADSRAKLESTQVRYGQLSATLKQAEASMAPVLQSLAEHTLYLKHNLNAASIQALKGEADNIEIQIRELVDHLRKSIAEAEAFVRTLD